jgi:uncharacterized alkaline shock family protein YloU
VSRDAIAFPSPLGRVELSRGALTALLVHAAEGVEGASVRRRGADATVADGRLEVTLAIDAPLGSVLRDLAGSVQQRVSAVVSATLELEATVDVVVEGLT